MAEKKVDHEKAAQALVDAHFTTDKAAADKHGVTARTIRNYRARLKTDEEFSACFLSLLKEVRDGPEWDWLTDGLRSAIAAAIECCATLSRSDPESLMAIQQTISTLSGYEQTKRVIDAELAQALDSSTPGYSTYPVAGPQDSPAIRAIA